MNVPEFDLPASHKYFSAHCFNQAWDLLEKSERTPNENEQMIRLSMASHWHWTQREDCTSTNLSVSCWQLSRIYAVLGEADNATKYAEKCLEISKGEDIPPFYRAYAYEALARAAKVAGNRDEMKKYLSLAQKLSETISDEEEKKWVLSDLSNIK